MGNALRKTLLEQLEQAETAYNRELENGSRDTEQHRQQVAGLKRDIEILDADEEAQQQMAEDDIEARMQEQAAREFEETATAMEAELREQAEIPVPNIKLPEAIFMNVQRAGLSLQSAREAESAAKARVDHLEARQASIEAGRQAIIARRAAGSGNDEADKADLTLADADLKGLAPMIEDARSALQATYASAQQAQAAYDQAASQQAQVVNTERERARVELAQSFDKGLIKIAPLAILRTGMSLSGYQPSLALYELVGSFR